MWVWVWERARTCEHVCMCERESVWRVCVPSLRGGDEELCLFCDCVCG